MKKRLLACVVILNLLFLTGCWDRNELNQLAFSTALGFDRTSEGDIVITAQILNPRAIAAQKNTNESSVVVVAKQGHSILETISSMSTELSREVVGTHMQTIVFGENFAKEGIAEATDFLLRYYQTSSELYFTVAKETTANEILNNLTKLENDPSAKINSSIVISQDIWAETNEIKLTELANCLASDGLSAVMTGIEMQAEKPDDSLEKLKLTQNDPLKLSGNAILKEDKLVGWLNEEESQGYNYIFGNASTSAFDLQEDGVGKVSFNMKHITSKQEISCEGGTPKVTVLLEMQATIQNMDHSLYISKQETLNQLQVLAEKKLKGICMTAVTKAKAVKSNIFGFGAAIHRTDPQQWNTVKKDWNDTGFVNLPVEMEADVTIIGTDSISQIINAKKE